MAMFRKIFFVAAIACWMVPAGQVLGEQPSAEAQKNIVLTPADQLILDAIGNVNDRIDSMNARIDNMNTRIDEMGTSLNSRIDNLWVTMLGGFLGVMAFIGALVFWDRRTFMKRAREEMRLELTEDRRKMEGMIAALRKLGTQFPEVGEVLRSFGLL